MKYIATYTFKPFMTKEETKTLLEAFAKFGNAPGVTAHYVRLDATGGFVIGESDDLAGMYRSFLNYSEFIDFEGHVVLSVEDSLPVAVEYAGQV